jgi:hypothetical protein
MLTFYAAMRTDRGLLVYPVHTANLSHAVRVRHIRAIMRHRAIDLGKKGQEFVQEYDRFTADVLAWASSGGTHVPDPSPII